MAFKNIALTTVPTVVLSSHEHKTIDAVCGFDVSIVSSVAACHVMGAVRYAPGGSMLAFRDSMSA